MSCGLWGLTSLQKGLILPSSPFLPPGLQLHPELTARPEQPDGRGLLAGLGCCVPPGAGRVPHREKPVPLCLPGEGDRPCLPTCPCASRCVHPGAHWSVHCGLQGCQGPKDKSKAPTEGQRWLVLSWGLRTRTGFPVEPWGVGKDDGKNPDPQPGHWGGSPATSVGSRDAVQGGAWRCGEGLLPAASLVLCCAGRKHPVSPAHLTLPSPLPGACLRPHCAQGSAHLHPGHGQAASRGRRQRGAGCFQGEEAAGCRLLWDTGKSRPSQKSGVGILRDSGCQLEE